MDHVAILENKQWLNKILSGEKTIESRWSKHRRPPYDCVSRGDTVWFKVSGEPVRAKAKVADALFFDNLTLTKIRKILASAGREIGMSVRQANVLSGKKFCTLVFLKHARRVAPFNINKKGYGLMTAWIPVADIASIKSNEHRRKVPQQTVDRRRC